MQILKLKYKDDPTRTGLDRLSENTVEKALTPRRRRYVVLRPGTMYHVMLIALLLLPVTGTAQLPGPCGGNKAGTIACLIADVASAANQQTFPGASFPRNATGNPYFASQLSISAPIPSTATGAVLKVDPNTGGLIPVNQTLGPIFAERAETIGQKKLYFGIAFQRFVYDTLEGIDIHKIPGAPVPGVRSIVNTGLQFNQFLAFATYGVAKNIDISLLVPVNTVFLSTDFQASAQLSPSGPTLTSHGFGHHTAHGIGDVSSQVKGTIFSFDHRTTDRPNAISGAIALGGRVRLPTGDEFEALGTGAYSITPFLAVSLDLGKVSPHLNVGYNFSGSSILAGDVVYGEKRRVPSQVPYAIGMEVGILRSFTIAGDVLGFEAIHGANINTLGGLERRSYNSTSGSTGFKLKLGRELFLTGNVLFRLNDGGLHYKVAPFIGLSYRL